MTGLRPYPEYRASGVEWLGEIPASWEVRRLNHVASTNNETLPETTDPDYELVYVDIGSVDASVGIQKKEPMTFGNAPSRARRKVREGDVIVSTVRTYLRAIAPITKLEDNLIVSTGFAVIRPQKNLESGFAAYALRAPYFVDAVVSRSVGVSYPAINASEIGVLEIAVPSSCEQLAIVAFLDRETARVDALMEKRQRQIELLQEKRAALITHAVTKGLDPNAPMKDSGLDWLGLIPAHWSVKRLKRVGKAIIGLTYDPSDLVDEDQGTLVLRASNVSEGRIVLGDNVFVRTEIPRRLVTSVGDILVCSRSGSRALIGKSAKIDERSAGLTFGTFMTIFRGPYNDYLFHVFNSALFDYQSGTFLTSTINQLTVENLRSFEVPIPPSQEQTAIAKFLNREVSHLRALEEKIATSIDRLREFRTALISAAVTGKIDVRNLPAPESEAVQEAEEVAS